MTFVGIEGKQEGRKKWFIKRRTLYILFMVICRVRHMIKDHTSNQTGNSLSPLHKLRFNWQQGIIYIHHLLRVYIHGLCYTSRRVLLGTVKRPVIDAPRRFDPAAHASQTRGLLTELISVLGLKGDPWFSKETLEIQ